MMSLIRELSPTEAAYVAGIIDGEGTITLAVTPRNGRYMSALRAAKERFEARFFAVSIRAGTNRSGRSLNDDDDDRGIRAAFAARAGWP